MWLNVFSSVLVFGKYLRAQYFHLPWYIPEWCILLSRKQKNLKIATLEHPLYNITKHHPTKLFNIRFNSLHKIA